MAQKKEKFFKFQSYFWPCFDFYMKCFVIFNQKLENEHLIDDKKGIKRKNKKKRFIKKILM